MAVDPLPPTPLVTLCLVFCLSLLLKQIWPLASIQRNSVKATILVTLVGTVGMFCSLPMLVCASWHHRSKKFNTGRERAQRFVAIWFLHRVSQLKLTRIIVMHRICVPALPTFCWGYPDQYGKPIPGFWIVSVWKMQIEYDYAGIISLRLQLFLYF